MYKSMLDEQLLTWRQRLADDHSNLDHKLEAQCRKIENTTACKSTEDEIIEERCESSEKLKRLIQERKKAREAGNRTESSEVSKLIQKETRAITRAKRKVG